MNEHKETIMVKASEVAMDWGISRSKAYDLIKRLNEDLRREFPRAIIMRGRINREYYKRYCTLNWNNDKGGG